MDESSSPSEDVFAVPIAGRWLLYAPLHGASALVNRAAVAQLASGDVRASTPALAELFALFQEPTPDCPIVSSGPSAPQFIGLITTRACNLSCRYCAFAAGTAPDKAMDLDLAVAAVDWMAGYVGRAGRQTLDVHFFGGEPMAAHEVVEVSVHRARAVAARKGLIPRFEIATNGVFGPGLAEFLGAHVDSVVLSFDGPRQIHDRHRPVSPGRGSFDAVARTAFLLGESDTALGLRACVSQDTVAQLPQLAEWFCKRFRPAAIDFEPLQRTPEALAAGLEPPQPLDFAENFRLAGKVAADHGVRCTYAASLIDEPRLSFCPVGNDTLIVAPDGSVRGCYLREREWRSRGLDLRLGQLTADGAMALNPDAVLRLRHLAADKPLCTRCFCRWSCAGGCHVNHSWPGGLNGYNAFCVQTRVVTACELLDRLGHAEVADRLVGDRDAARALARQPSDRVRDFDATSCPGAQRHA